MHLEPGVLVEQTLAAREAGFRGAKIKVGRPHVSEDVARIGGITPWLKVAHLAVTFNVAICPYFLMEIHLGLCAAVPNAAWVEYIPQLEDVTTSRLAIADGFAWPSEIPGLGIAWDAKALAARRTGALAVVS